MTEAAQAAGGGDVPAQANDTPAPEQQTPATGDGAPVENQDTGANNPETVTKEPQATDFSIPDEYKEKGWASKINSEEDLWKTLDWAQSARGKKTAVPDFDNASKEEISEYIESTRPESKDAYKFAEDMPEQLSAAYKDTLYEAGVTPYQANQVIEKMTEFEKEMISEMQDPDKFEEMAKETFGDDYKDKTDKVFADLKELNAFDEREQLIFDKSTNEQQLMFYKAAQGLRDQYDQKIAKLEEEYGATETGAQGEGGQGAPVMDLDKEASDISDEIIKENAAQPPNFEKINELKSKLKDVNQKRAARNN